MIQYKKLQKLADHLKKGKLGHLIFNFSCINDGDSVEVTIDPKTLKIKASGCGTSGCAMGELPIVFPKDWVYPEPEIEVEGGQVYVIVSSEPEPKFASTYHDLDKRVAQFFGISVGAVSHLFYPNAQDPESFGGKDLDTSATREQVAANIEAFIKKMKGK